MTAHGEVGNDRPADLRSAERRTIELSEHLQLALQAGRLGTWRWDIVAGTTVWDERLEALFGLAPGAFDGTYETYLALLHDEDRDDVLARVHQALASASHYRADYRVTWPDGSVHWLSEAGGVVLDDHGAVIGTVGCANDVTDRIERDTEHQRLVELAMDAADRERIQRERLELIARINDTLNTASTVREIMSGVTRAAVPRLGDWCSIHVLAHRSSTIPLEDIAHADPRMVAYARELQPRFPYEPAAPSGVPFVIRTGETLFLPIIDERVIGELDATDAERSLIDELALGSMIVVPLVKRGNVLGAMRFVMSSSSRHYTDDDVSLAQSVAGRIASSLENLRLNDQQRLIAKTLQRSLLPPSLPTIPGIDLAARYWPTGEATDVGGDFYDVFELGTSDHWALVMGDVCGTGPEAAALTGLARHTIRDSAWHGDSPVEVLAALNRSMRRAETSSFLTAAYTTLDTSGTVARLTVACGGHPLPIRVGEHGAERIGVPGTLLGVIDRGAFQPVTVELDAGDVVVLYTDGATDLPPPHLLTAVEFAALVQRAASSGGTADTIADRIEAALDDVLPFSRRADDIALLVLRVEASGGAARGMSRPEAI